MVKQTGLLVFSLLFLPALTGAQSNCPQGFVYVGNLSGSGSFSEEFNQKKALKLPENATLDDSFQQSTVRAASKKGKTDLRPQDIPKGIVIIPHGTNDHDTTWSVSEPRLTTIKEGDGTASTRYEFGMRLSCRVQTSPFNQQGGDCYVEVEVCYKPKPVK